VEITASSFNTDLREPIRKLVEGDQNNIQTGYGGVMLSSNIVKDQLTNVYPLVDDSQWDNLRLDIIRVRTHQSGIPNITDVAQGDNITLAIYGEYLTLAQQAIVGKDDVAVGQYADTVPGTLVNPPLNVSFSNFAYHRTTAAWNNPTEANQFFNAGGGFLLNFTFNNSLTGQAANQGVDFSALASQLGTRFFGVAQWRASTSNFVDWTPLVTSSNGNYTGNKIQFRSRVNGGGSGNSAQLTFEIRMTSDYQGVGPSGSGVWYGDQITGQTVIQILQRESIGAIVGPKPVAWAYDSQWTVGAGPVT
jgi:hypothetical protein